jgi:hypothetical protein
LASYASIAYPTPAGNTSITLGNNVVEQWTANDRSQVTKLNVLGSGSATLLTLGFFPCASQQVSCSTGNNGNVRSHTIGPNPNLTQVYGYNQLNQLTSASETNPGATSTFWTRSYGYTNGNMYVTNNGPLVNGSPGNSAYG